VDTIITDNLSGISNEKCAEQKCAALHDNIHNVDSGRNAVGFCQMDVDAQGNCCTGTGTNGFDHPLQANELESLVRGRLRGL